MSDAIAKANVLFKLHGMDATAYRMSAGPDKTRVNKPLRIVWHYPVLDRGWGMGHNGGRLSTWRRKAEHFRCSNDQELGDTVDGLIEHWQRLKDHYPEDDLEQVAR